MTDFVSDFVHQFTENIERTVSQHNDEIGKLILNKKVLTCKRRLKKVCCKSADDSFDPFESQDMCILYEIGEDDMLMRNGTHDADETDNNHRENRFIDEVLTHIYHMQVLVEKTLNNGKLFEDEEWRRRHGPTVMEEHSDDFDNGGTLLSERSILIDSGV